MLLKRGAALEAQDKVGVGWEAAVQSSNVHGLAKDFLAAQWRFPLYR
jgi:hypothetical protein